MKNFTRSLVLAIMGLSIMGQAYSSTSQKPNAAKRTVCAARCNIGAVAAAKYVASGDLYAAAPDKLTCLAKCAR
jgi:hypothetical protein